MAVSSAVLNVHTDDANPDASLYKISNKAGHTDATATIRISGTLGGSSIGAIRMVTSTDRRAAPVANLGCVCGIDRCGAPGVRPLKVSTVPWDFVGLVTYAEAGAGADRDVTVNVFTLIDPDGWV